MSHRNRMQVIIRSVHFALGAQAAEYLVRNSIRKGWVDAKWGPLGLTKLHHLLITYWHSITHSTIYIYICRYIYIYIYLTILGHFSGSLFGDIHDADMLTLFLDSIWHTIFWPLWSGIAFQAFILASYAASILTFPAFCSDVLSHFLPFLWAFYLTVSFYLTVCHQLWQSMFGPATPDLRKIQRVQPCCIHSSQFVRSIAAHSHDVRVWSLTNVLFPQSLSDPEGPSRAPESPRRRDWTSDS